MARTCFPPAWSERCPRDSQASIEMRVAAALGSCPWMCFLANSTEPRNTAHGGGSFGDWIFWGWEVMGMGILGLKCVRKTFLWQFASWSEVHPPGSLMGKTSSVSVSVLWGLFLQIWQCHRIPEDAAVSVALCRHLVEKNPNIILALPVHNVTRMIQFHLIDQATALPSWVSSHLVTVAPSNKIQPSSRQSRPFT